MCYLYFYDSNIGFEAKEDLYDFYYDKNYKNDNNLIKPPNSLSNLNPNFDHNFYINYYDTNTYDTSTVYFMTGRIKELENIEKDTLNYLRIFSFNEINDTIMFGNKALSRFLISDKHCSKKDSSFRPKD